MRTRVRIIGGSIFNVISVGADLCVCHNIELNHHALGRTRRSAPYTFYLL